MRADSLRDSAGGGDGGVAKRLELAEQDFREAAVEAAGARLGQGVGGAERKRRDGLLGAFLGQRRDDHHLGAGRRANDPRNRLQAAGAGHLEVEQDDVDAALR